MEFFSFEAFRRKTQLTRLADGTAASEERDDEHQSSQSDDSGWEEARMVAVLEDVLNVADLFQRNAADCHQGNSTDLRRKQRNFSDKSSASEIENQ